MRKFINSAEANGIELIDQMDALKTIRFKVSNLARASRYFDQFEDEMEPQFNYRVRTPELPRPEFLEGEKSFGDKADDWIGTPAEREDWGRGVKVAILDSGIDRTHSNLDGVSIEEIDLLGTDSSSRGHGTAIASIISEMILALWELLHPPPFFPFVYWMGKGRAIHSPWLRESWRRQIGVAGDQS